MHHGHRADPTAPSPTLRPPTDRLAILGRLTPFLAGLIAALLLIVWLLPEDADARRKRRRRVEPPLRIVSIAMTPETYIAGHGALDITIDVKLPPDVDGTTVLEVSSLITSPSKRHTRFLRSRKPIDLFLQPPPAADGPVAEDGATSPHPSAATAAPPPAPPSRDRILVTLRWDGTDQNQEVVSGGRYDYVIRAKLLAPEGEKLRTRMVSWKKKGSIRIKPAEAAPPQEPVASDTEAVDGEDAAADAGDSETGEATATVPGDAEPAPSGAPPAD